MAKQVLVKETYTVDLTVQCAGRGGWQERHEIKVEATSEGRAKAQATKIALAGRTDPYRVHVFLAKNW